MKVDDAFTQQFSSLFVNPADIAPGTLFRVIDLSPGLTLAKVE